MTRAETQEDKVDSKRHAVRAARDHPEWRETFEQERRALVELHVVAIGDPQWHEYLLFRDRLRTDEVLRARYAEFKGALQQRYVEDHRGYTSAKKAFIEDLE